MNSLSGLSRSVSWPLHTVSNAVTGITLSSKVLVAAGMALMGLDTVAAAPLQRRYDGGVIIKQPDFPSLKPIVTEVGPFYSPELSCRMQNVSKPNIHSYFRPNFLSDWLYRSNSLESDQEPVSGQIPSEILPYCEIVNGIAPQRLRAAKHFPDNLSAFLFAGIGLVENGNKGCYLNFPPFYIVCEDLTEMLKSKVSKEVFESENTDANYRASGFHLSVTKDYIHNIDPRLPRSDLRIYYGINPEIHVNYKLALAELEKTILNDDCFFRKEPTEIVEFIKKIHKILMNNIPGNYAHQDEMNLAGKFRKTVIFVFKKSLEEDEKELIAFYEKNNKPSLAKLVKSAFSKVKLNYPMTKKERAMIDTVAYIPAPVDDIQKQMDSFAEKFKQLAQAEVHPIALAAWVHMQIVNIHPFGDGNGRIARLFLNTMLVRGGYEPLIFLDRDQYVKAVEEDHKIPGAFAAYLAQEMEQQSKSVPLLAQN